MHVLILEISESDKAVLEDVFEMLSDRTSLQIADLA